MTTTEVYWLTRLDNLNTLFWLLGIAAGIALIITPFLYMMLDVDASGAEQEREAKKTTARYFRRTLIACVGFCSLACFMPTTKELIAIYGISYLTQNKDAREIPAEALKVLNQKLKDMESN